MESVKRDTFAWSSTVVSEWDATATTTVIACTAWCATSFVVLAAANATKSKPSAEPRNTVCGKRERGWKWHTDNRQRRKWGRRCGGARTVHVRPCTRAPDTCPAGSHVRRRPLGFTWFARHDQECGSRSGVTISGDGSRHDGVGYAATRVRVSPPLSFRSVCRHELIGICTQLSSRLGPIRVLRIPSSLTFIYLDATTYSRPRLGPGRLLRLVTRRCFSCSIRRRGTRCRRLQRRSCKLPSPHFVGQYGLNQTKKVQPELEIP